MTKNPKTLNKKEKILLAAVKVFSSKGFHEAKVEEIARVADIGKGTVYEYFSSKAELFQEMFKAGIEFYQEKMHEHLESELNAAEKIQKLARLHLQFVLEYKDLAKVTMGEHAHFGEEFRSLLMKMRQQRIFLIEKTIADGIEKGEFKRDINPKTVATMFFGIMGSIFGMTVFGGEKIEEKTVDEMLAIIFNGIKEN